MPVVSMSAETLLDTYGLYHLTQLEADPDLAEFVEPFRQAQERLRARNEQHRAAEAATLVALAVRDRKDAAVNEAVMRVHHAILEMVRKDRHAPLYAKYFPDGLRPLTSVAVDTEARRVGTIAAKLAEETDEALTSLAPPLTAALQDLDAAITAHDHAVSAEAQSSGILQSEKMAWLDAYQQEHHKLQIRFHDRPRLAESYFRQAPHEHPAPPTPPPAEQPATSDSPAAGAPIAVVAERADADSVRRK